jgi:hypothetical protein
MRLLFLAVFLIVNLLGAKDCKAQTGTFIWTNGAPTTNPGASGARFAVDRATFRWYEWVSGTSWVQSGDRIQRISGCAAPAYTPTIHNAYFVINGCTEPEFYYWNGTAWKLLNGGGGATYTAGSGIAISGTNVISADTSILATQYDISQLGVTFPLLAPNSGTPNYSFSSSPGTGMFYSFEDNPIFYIQGEENLAADQGTAISILAGNGSGVGGGFEMRAGTSYSAGGNGGSFNMFGGGANVDDGGTGGSFFLEGGQGAVGGEFILKGGNGRTTGGNINILSGLGLANGNGGNIQIQTISPSGSGTLGDFTLQTGTTGLVKPIITNSAGIQYKALTTTQRNALTGLTEGRLIWNTTTKSFNSHDGTSWHEIPKIIKASATLNFPSTGAHSSSDLTVTVTGAAIRDGVVIQPDPAAIVANSCYTAWVSATNTVTVRYNHYGSGSSDPASNVFDLTIIKR